MQIVKRERFNGEILTKALMIALCTVTFLLFLLLVGSPMGALMIIACALAVVAAVLVFRSFKLEYEYEVQGTDFHVSKIIAKNSRKGAQVFDLNKLESLKPFKADGFKNHSQYKVYDFTSGLDSDNIYEARIYYKNEIVLMYIEPNEEILAAIKYINPNKMYF